MTNNELRVNGTQNFMGIDIPVIEGGFGENCRVVTDKTIAEIHGIKTFKVRERINDNLKRFKEGIDYLDIKRILDADTLINLGYAKQSITQAEIIFLLSERGYAKLIKIMDSDKAWEVHDQLIDEYFTMREVIKSSEQLKAQLLLSIYDGGQDAILASKQLTELEVKEATIPLLQKIEDDKPYTDFAKHVTESSDTVDVGEFSKIVKNENINIGRNRLFEWLRNNKYLMSNNIPYQKYIENNYFVVTETTKETAYGTKIFTKTLITGKGQVALVEKLRKEFGMAA